ncbi:hypothetical protein TIFTF001_033543 [Ficus carica]|uniref:Uncharacterized protein n=1 Tax=Ficus carica TaxID=3494 RepID=A0AA88DYP4_FICCA|nr:hypothetical protein TIFTF001_033543 [Ficus carica]
MNKCKRGRFGRIGRDSRKQFCIGINLLEQSVLKMLRECYSISGKIWGAISVSFLSSPSSPRRNQLRRSSQSRQSTDSHCRSQAPPSAANRYLVQPISAQPIATMQQPHSPPASRTRAPILALFSRNKPAIADHPNLHKPTPSSLHRSTSRVQPPPPLGFPRTSAIHLPTKRQSFWASNSLPIIGFKKGLWGSLASQKLGDFLWTSSYIMPVATRTRRCRRESVRAEPESSESEPEQSLERVERFRSADAIDRF